MRARAFFSLLKEADKSKRRRDASNYIELSRIAAIPGCTTKYGDGLIKMFQGRLSGEEEQMPARPPTIGMATDDPVAMSFMAESFATHRRLNGQ